jgi:Ca2+-binding RTX toxin-like protein
MELNVLLRGQSNAYLLALSPDWGSTLASKVEQLLGFNGTTDKVNVLDSYYQPSGDNTINSGTAFIGDWVTPVNGNWQNGWTNNTLETGLINYIDGLPADEKAAPTAVVWLHNEYDSTNPNLNTAEWMSAVQFEAQQVRAAFGQSATTVPYVFVNAIPYAYNLIPAVNQDIKLGMELFAGNPSFHATIGAQANDTNMDYGQPGYYGGSHMDTADANQTDQRLALSIAQEFAQYAQPGSPVATGQLDAYGPEVMTAQRIGTDQVLVTAALDHASLNPALSTDAAQGVGWSIIDNGQTLNATAAQVMDGGQVLLTFSNPVPTDATASLYYTYGYGRLAIGNVAGQGNAIYDSQGLPIWGPATGVPIAGATAGTFTEQNLVTGGITAVQGTPSVLPGTDAEFAVVTPDSVAVTADTPNAFLVAGPGTDELIATSGDNTLDAGQGTAIMYGGSGADTFWVNGGSTPSWDAIAGFHTGDTLVIWGATLGASQTAWSGGGQNIETLTVSGGGIASSAIAFVGVTPSQAQSFAIGGGTVGGSHYITVTHG